MDPRARKIELTESPRPPLDGLIFGWGAMLPLGLCAFGAWLGDAHTVDLSRACARVWGAALLLFFAGVRRGLSFRTEGGPRVSQMLAFCVLFATGLAVLAMPLSWSLAALGLAFAALAVEDMRAARHGEAPLYFLRLRPWQMSFAVLTTALCWAAPA